MNKMKKNKMLILSSLILMSLFIGSSTINAVTNATVDYPSTVKLGDSFEVNLIFDYPYDSDCIYSRWVIMYWSINVAIDYTNILREYIYDIPDFPRPSNFIFSLSTDFFGSLEVGDVIILKIRYVKGVLGGTSGQIKWTDTCRITITDTVSQFDWTDWLNWVYIGAGVLGAVIIVVVLIIIKKRK